MKSKQIILFLLLFSLGVAFAGRTYHLVTRYFDVDEFAHLHWAYLVFSGKIPYKDFFLNTTPVYQLFMLPVFLFPWSSGGLIFARLVQVPVFLGIMYFTFLLGLSIGGVFTGLMSALIFMVFPMLFVKSIEIRPDMMMYLFYLWGAWVLIRELKKTAVSDKIVFLSGLFTGLSVLVMAKMVVGLPAIFWLILSDKRIRTVKYIIPFMVGLALPAGLFIIWTILTGTTALAWEYIIEGSNLIKAGEGAFSPWKSLSPWPYVYLGAGGQSYPWLVNCILWILSLFGLLAITIKKRTIGIFLGIFIAGNVAGLFLFPTPFMQYFIPICGILAICVSYLVNFISRTKLFTGIAPVVYLICAVLLLASFGYQLIDRMPLDSGEQRKVIDDILKISDPSETFYDMVGSYVYRPDGYHICCNIYPHIRNGLRVNPGPLRNSLIKNRTKFIVMDRVGKSFWLPEPDDLSFIFSHYQESRYRKIYVLGSAYNCYSSICNQVNSFGENLQYGLSDSVEIVIAEKYKLATIPAGSSVTINNQILYDGQSISLDKGIYKFTVGPELTKFSVMLDR